MLKCFCLGEGILKIFRIDACTTKSGSILNKALIPRKSLQLPVFHTTNVPASRVPVSLTLRVQPRLPVSSIKAFLPFPASRHQRGGLVPNWSRRKWNASSGASLSPASRRDRIRPTPDQGHGLESVGFDPTGTRNLRSYEIFPVHTLSVCSRTPLHPVLLLILQHKRIR